MNAIKLARSFTMRPDNIQAIVLGCLTYAAAKLWNIANYERKSWCKDSGEPYPNWYEQKKRLKTHYWYKALPSQSAQEVLKVLNSAWQSFYTSKKSGLMENPRPPRYKHTNFNIKYLSGGFKILPGNKIRLTLPKQLKQHLQEEHNLELKFLFVDVPKHLQLQEVKTVEIKPLVGGKYELIFVMEVEAPELKTECGNFMACDIGIFNFLTCYLYNGISVIFSGRQLLSINRYYDKTISYYQGIAWGQQGSQNKKFIATRKMEFLYQKRRLQVKHLLHCMSRELVNFAQSNGIDTIVIGDLTGIRKEANLGRKTNQKFHKLPYDIVINQIKYKARLAGINVVDNITEEYTSQSCAACKQRPSKENAVKANRKHRGLYICRDCGTALNADVNGAINISKKYLETLNRVPVVVLGTPVVYRFNGNKFRCA